MPLHYACATRDLENVRVLLDRGADRSAAMEFHGQPIDIAAIHKHDQIVKLLFAEGSTLNVTTLDTLQEMTVCWKTKITRMKIENKIRVTIQRTARIRIIMEIRLRARLMSASSQALMVPAATAFFVGCVAIDHRPL